MTALTGGFAAPAPEAARAFRALLDAMSRPGLRVTLEGARPPAPLSPAAGAVLLALCDAETPLWLAPSCDGPAPRAWIAFHCAAPLTADRGSAAFALGRWDELRPLADFAPGTAEYPDRAATLIVELDSLAPQGTCLAGPGIRGIAALSLPDLSEREALPAFPLGLDMIFTAGTTAAALPRSTRIVPCM